MLAPSLVVLFALLAVAGLANAVAQPAINLFMAEQVALDRQGLAFGIKQSAIPAAILVSGLALPVLALPLGWRPTFAICGGLVLVVAASRGGGRGPSARRRSVEPPPRASRQLVYLAVGAALAASGANALGTYLVASAVDVGIAEGTAGLLAAAGSAGSLSVRMALGLRADRRRDYGYATVAYLLAVGAPATGSWPRAGARRSWRGPPGLRPRLGLAGTLQPRRGGAPSRGPGAATGITQSGIYVGAAGGPALSGCCQARSATRPPGRPWPGCPCWPRW